MAKAKFYTVWIGRQPGVYSNWADCEAQIHGFEGAVYKSFPNLTQAEEAFQNNSREYIGVKNSAPVLTPDEILRFGSPISNSICVDGAANTVSHDIEYQGVEFPSGRQIFHAGPFYSGTNNIAEFLAIVHALAYCKERSLDTVIYSDSRTAMSWVRRKKAKTKVMQDSSTMHILSLVERAERWLHANQYGNQILKWETAIWGENPADFGRK